VVRLSSLRGARSDDGALAIGAMTTHAEVTSSYDTGVVRLTYAAAAWAE
jgi:hypothetical protein